MLVLLFSIVGIILAGLLIALAVVLLNSPGKLEPLRDGHGNIIPGSISEKVFVEINGIRQGMFIRGENPENPVILYVHGGPGTPMLQFVSYLEKLNESELLEKHFTICYWDQRGSGMTYTKSTDPSAMTVEQLVEDTRKVTEYLMSRFRQDKIFIMGHSWGSYLGIKTIEKHPENYLAYIGIGQVSNQTESERLSYDYILTHAKEIDDIDVIALMERFDPNSADFPLMKEESRMLDYLLERTEPLMKYGIGHVHQMPEGMTFKSMLLKTLFPFKGYTLKEKINWLRGADFSMVHLYPYVVHDNLFESSVEFEVPVYIVMGVYDYQVSQVLAEKYCDAISAPRKEFFLFENSAHSPNLEEPERFIDVFHKIASE